MYTVLRLFTERLAFWQRPGLRVPLSPAPEMDDTPERGV
jgi:hypothetical protein